MLISGKRQNLVADAVKLFSKPTTFPWGERDQATARIEGMSYPSALVTLHMAAGRLSERVFRIEDEEGAFDATADDLRRALVRITTTPGGEQLDPRLIALKPDEAARVSRMIRAMLRAYEKHLPEIARRAVGTILVGVDRALNDPNRLLELFGEPEPPDIMGEVNQLWREVQVPAISARLMRESGWDRLSERDRELLRRVIGRARERRPLVGLEGFRVRSKAPEELELLLSK
jgi:hypothetical protein